MICDECTAWKHGVVWPKGQWVEVEVFAQSVQLDVEGIVAVLAWPDHAFFSCFSFLPWNQTTPPFVSPHCKCCVVSDLQFRFAVALATGNCFYLPTTYSMSSLCLYPPYIEFNILHASSPSLRVRDYLWEELQSFGGFKFQHPKWRPPHTQT